MYYLIAGIIVMVIFSLGVIMIKGIKIMKTDKKLLKEAREILEKRQEYLIAPEVEEGLFQKFCYELYNDDNFIFLIASIREGLRYDLELSKVATEICNTRAIFLGISILLKKIEHEAKLYIQKTNPLKGIKNGK